MHARTHARIWSGSLSNLIGVDAMKISLSYDNRMVCTFCGVIPDLNEWALRVQRHRDPCVIGWLRDIWSHLLRKGLYGLLKAATVKRWFDYLLKDTRPGVLLFPADLKGINEVWCVSPPPPLSLSPPLSPPYSLSLVQWIRRGWPCPSNLVIIIRTGKCWAISVSLSLSKCWRNGLGERPTG